MNPYLLRTRTTTKGGRLTQLNTKHGNKQRNAIRCEIAMCILGAFVACSSATDAAAFGVAVTVDFISTMKCYTPIDICVRSWNFPSSNFAI